eukprot:snap_masked-scaffold40_size501252-processed-gene-0.1 protein:Tk06153 transcript:snap_masked-scaffold40_size501252-processed-gene-0.1-mRNA-1 annotation:"tyrosine-protein kinase hopscotch"
MEDRLIRLFNPVGSTASLAVIRSHSRSGALTAEGCVLFLCRDRLQTSPVTWPLFGLRGSQGLWLSPDQPLDELPWPKDFHLELRLRFKLPEPRRLWDWCPKSLDYYFHQVREDYISGRMLEAKINEIETYKQNKLHRIIPRVRDNDSPLRIDLFKKVVIISPYLVCLTVLQGGSDLKGTLSQMDQWMPQQVWASRVEKLAFGNKAVRNEVAENCAVIARHTFTAQDLKIRFLFLVEEAFPFYHEVTASGHMRAPGYHGDISIQLTFRPPLKRLTDDRVEDEPALLMHPVIGKTAGYVQREEICRLDEIGFLHVDQKETGQLSIELARKNGIPFTWTMESKPQALSFLSHVAGYYRLCEKWNFVLCRIVNFPALSASVAEQIHGPITNEFVHEKMNAPGRKKPGSFLVHQGLADYERYFLHVWVSGQTKPSVYTLERTQEGYVVRGMPMEPQSTMQAIRHKITEAHSEVVFNASIHVSEYDKAPTLLLCRSLSKLKGDILGSGEDGSGTESKMVISFSHLARGEQRVKQGEYTVVWPGTWTRTKQSKVDVSIKQLKKEFARSHLEDFTYLSQKVLSWDNRFLIEYFGTTLATKSNPMALVGEFYGQGHLAGYLQRNQGIIRNLELLEACRSMAKALWYLEERGMVHGKVSCQNIFVAQHTDQELHVKLGDPGIDGEYTTSDYHWLAVEQLRCSDPCSRRHCTLKSDLWALGTTMWEIFSLGSEPSLECSHEEIRRRYIEGYRLQKPTRLGDLTGNIYRLMEDLWSPNPEARPPPHQVFRDVSLVFSRLFNAENVAPYATIPDSPGYRPNSESDPQSSTSTLDATDEMDLSNMITTNMDADAQSNLSYGTTRLVPRFNHPSLIHMWFPPNQDSYNGTGSNDSSPYHDNASHMTSLTSLSSSFTTTDSISVASIYEIDEHKLTFNEHRPLGEGNFGLVFKGIWTKDGEDDTVAIKKLKDSENLPHTAAEELRQELNIMKELNNKNIVRIKGFTRSSSLMSGMLIVMEFIPHGSLLSYLNCYQDTIDFPKQLLEWAQNIVDGMIYLGEKKIIHRDLAARNILVASEDQVKISDFGLARTLKSDVYCMSSNSRIPIQWIAPEGLHSNLYSVKSDVWSFGVTLWEMFSFGKEPFLHGCENYFRNPSPEEDPGIVEERQYQESTTWKKLLESGARLPGPAKCPAALYTQVMSQCWHFEPEKRPKFEKLARRETTIDEASMTDILSCAEQMGMKWVVGDLCPLVYQPDTLSLSAQEVPVQESQGSRAERECPTSSKSARIDGHSKANPFTCVWLKDEKLFKKASHLYEFECDV